MAHYNSKIKAKTPPCGKADYLSGKVIDGLNNGPVHKESVQYDGLLGKARQTGSHPSSDENS